MSDCPPLAERLNALFDAPDYQPQSADELIRRLRLSDAPSRRALKALVQEALGLGLLIKLSGGRLARRKPRGGSMRGRVITLRNGKKLFRPDAEGLSELQKLCPAWEGDTVPIQEGRAMDAMDGDEVRAAVRLQRPCSPRRRGMRPASVADFTPSARVEEVLRRGHGKWVGSYQNKGRFGIMAGDGATSPTVVKLTTPPPAGLLPFMTVVVAPETYPIGRSDATGHITEVLGWPEDANVQIATVMRKYELPEAFPEAVLRETERIPETVSPAECRGRDDWRERCVITIDPETARDYDDAIALTKTNNGWELAVHIADVSHYVAPGSALDKEALKRGNSTYLPDRVLPMLPPRLSDGICSLREGEDRLTRLCLMHINRQGKVFKAFFRDAVIRSRRRMTYAQALAVLQGGSSGDAACDTMLREAHKLAQLLRRKRFESGALNLDMPELRVVTDDRGQPVDVEINASDEAHQLIEEFMLAANETVAHALNAHSLPALYRVHEEPDPAKLHSFALQLKSYGIPAGTLATREELRRVMDALAGHPDEEQLKVALLRCMMRARYSPRALGHYGLAKGDYCHFTSPIRRYADLVVHRAFSRLTDSPAPPALARPAVLEAQAEHLSDTERISAAAEAEADRQMLALYMAAQCEAEHPREWTATVTACWAQGLAVEIPLLRLKGFVAADALPADTRWFYERHADRWSSVDARVLMPGSRLRVVPVNVDPATGFVDFRPIS